MLFGRKCRNCETLQCQYHRAFEDLLATRKELSAVKHAHTATLKAVSELEDQLADAIIAARNAERYRAELQKIRDSIHHLLDETGDNDAQPITVNSDPELDTELTPPEIRSLLISIGMFPGSDNHYYCRDCGREIINAGEVKHGEINTRRLINNAILGHKCPNARITTTEY